jgi:hypothetical protein
MESLALEFLHSPLSPKGERANRARPGSLSKNVENPGRDNSALLFLLLSLR